MRALIQLESEVRKGKPPTITIEEYVAWGDYEVPDEIVAAAAAAAAAAARPCLPRLMRKETFVDPKTRSKKVSAASNGDNGEDDAIDDAFGEVRDRFEEVSLVNSRKSFNRSQRIELAKRESQIASSRSSIADDADDELPSPPKAGGGVPRRLGS